MKITNIISSCVIALSLMSLSGCITTKNLNGKAEKRSIDHQYLSNLSAYIDNNKDLHLCVDLLDKESTKLATVSQYFKWSNFEGKTSSRLTGTFEYFLENNKYIIGCKVRTGFTPINITAINIDLEIKDYSSEYYKYIQSLPVVNAEYSLYLLNSNNFKKIASKCSNIFGSKDCSYDLSHSWPRLVIKANTKNKRSSVTILSGRMGDKKGYKPGDVAKAIAIDVITFPFQASILVWYVLFGAH